MECLANVESQYWSKVFNKALHNNIANMNVKPQTFYLLCIGKDWWSNDCVPHVANFYLASLQNTLWPYKSINEEHKKNVTSMHLYDKYQKTPVQEGMSCSATCNSKYL